MLGGTTTLALHKHGYSKEVIWWHEQLPKRIARPCCPCLRTLVRSYQSTMTKSLKPSRGDPYILHVDPCRWHQSRRAPRDIAGASWPCHILEGAQHHPLDRRWTTWSIRWWHNSQRSSTPWRSHNMSGQIHFGSKLHFIRAHVWVTPRREVVPYLAGRADVAQRQNLSSTTLEHHTTSPQSMTNHQHTY